MKETQNKKIAAGARWAALLLAAALVCTVVPLGLSALLGDRGAAMEASLFNGERSYEATQPAAAQITQGPGKAVPMGGVFGIKLFTDGVIVASLSQVETARGLRCPAEEAGIRAGDYLLEADGQLVTGNASLAQVIGRSGGQPVTLLVRRGKEEFTAQVTPAVSGGTFLTGMWVRDSAAGIGTLSFYDPETGAFAGLGHGICDMDVNAVMRLKSGEPADITLLGVDKGSPREPGMLKGYFSGEDSLGVLTKNNETGLYGELYEAPAGEALDILPREAVHTGAAEILATVDEGGVARYAVEIEEVSGPEQRTRNLVLKVTDRQLVEKTGGIVQGMSGCPILQDGGIAGVVTHVFVEDPTRGYGIFAQTMWEELRQGP